MVAVLLARAATAKASDLAAFTELASLFAVSAAEDAFVAAFVAFEAAPLAASVAFFAASIAVPAAPAASLALLAALLAAVVALSAFCLKYSRRRRHHWRFGCSFRCRFYLGQIRTGIIRILGGIGGICRGLFSLRSWLLSLLPWHQRPFVASATASVATSCSKLTEPRQLPGYHRSFSRPGVSILHPKRKQQEAHPHLWIRLAVCSDTGGYRLYLGFCQVFHIRPPFLTVLLNHL